MALVLVEARLVLVRKFNIQMRSGSETVRLSVVGVVLVSTSKQYRWGVGSTVEPRFNEGPRDCKNLFSITKISLYRFFPYTGNYFPTSNNQRLQSVGDNDQGSKRFFSSVLCVSFMWQMVKTCMIRLRVIEGPKVRDQSAFCSFHTFLVEIQTNAHGYIHATHAY